MAEWLAHSTAKQKVAGSNPTRASGWKTPSVHPAVKWVPELGTMSQRLEVQVVYDPPGLLSLFNCGY